MPAKTRKMFAPTSAQIDAAKALFAAMALEQTIRPIVTKYQTEILARHRFPIAAVWVEKGGAKPDEIILDPALSYLLDEANAATYFAECHAARDAAGLVVRAPDNCPLCEAESLRMDAEAALLRSIATMPGLEHLGRGYMTPELRQKAVELTLRLLAPFVGNAPAILQQFAGPRR